MFAVGWEVCGASDPRQGEHSQVLWLQLKGFTSLSLQVKCRQAGDFRGEEAASITGSPAPTAPPCNKPASPKPLEWRMVPCEGQNSGVLLTLGQRGTVGQTNILSVMECGQCWLQRLRPPPAEWGGWQCPPHRAWRRCCGVSSREMWGIKERLAFWSLFGD